jgi:hypothetical protein
MPATGGSIESINLNGRNFAVAADSDAQIKYGGSNNDVAANGNNTARILKTSEPWSISDASVEVDPDNGDQVFLQGIADGNGWASCTITLASGAILQGDGTITGDLATSTANATASLSLMGTGVLTEQAGGVLF